MRLLYGLRFACRARREPYWQRLEEGAYLGFRRGPDTWVARLLHELRRAAFRGARLILEPVMKLSSNIRRSILPAMLALLGIIWQTTLCAAEAPVSVPAPTRDLPKHRGPFQTAVLSGGCFWGVQGVYEHVKGVSKVVSGYAGGDPLTARYDRVSTGKTGHAESVQITYDPAKVSYGQLLQIFSRWSTIQHN
jgi:Peptide methionine sulfoxide reductase